VIINASGCGTTVKDYGHLFACDPGMARPAARIAALACDISEFLSTIGLRKSSAGVPAYRVAYHDPCSMQHVQKVTEQPRAAAHRRFRGRRRSGAAFLLRLGRHLQSAAA
jgi:glycolate oxidase iron-sulfur subunit